MSKAIPSIQKYMTTTPHSIGRDQPLSVAHRMMADHDIRHLPVLDAGRLVGMLTDRDLRFIESFKDADPTRLKVEDAMTTSVYSTTPDALLDEVCDTMAENKFGSAVVLANGKVVGIFTTVDVCRALSSLLHGRLAK